MRKPAPVVEWMITENDADWERRRILSLPDSEPAAQRHRPLKRYCWSAAALLLLLVGAGDWWWRTTQGRAHQAEAELRVTAQRELGVVVQGPAPLVATRTGNLTDADWWLQHAQAMPGLHTAVQTADCDTQIDGSLRTVEFQGDQAVDCVATVPPRRNEPTIVEQLANRQALAEFQATTAVQGQVVQREVSLHAAVKADKPGAQFDLNVRVLALQGDQAVVSVSAAAIAGAPAYQQTRFYRRTDAGWVRTDPDAVLWGPARSLETPSIIYHFRQNDAAVVIAVAPQIEALYTTMRRNVGLPRTSAPDKPVHLPFMPDAEKLVIDVSMTQPPGDAVPWSGAPDRISVPSPALYLAPVELTDVELLAQSIALSLLEQVLAQASQHRAVGQSWQPLLDGLRLWQLWEMDLPLAVWHDDVVTWIYADLPATRPGQAVVLPEHYMALCAAHKLWMPSPTQLNIPLVYTAVDQEALLWSLWGLYNPPTHLNQLGVPLRPGEYMQEPESRRLDPHPGHTVALATLVEYAVATYGRERVPVLMAGLGQYESWETLLPAVFDVSATEFEAGWQAYLAAHYGV